MSLLNYFVAIAPVFQQLVLDDCHFTIADTEKFIVSLPGKRLKLNIQEGDAIQEGATAEAIREKRKVIREGDKQLFGIAHTVICVPIMENGESVGCVAIGYSREKNDKMLQISEMLSAMIQNISGSSQTVAAAASELNDISHTLSHLSEGMKDRMYYTSQAI